MVNNLEEINNIRVEYKGNFERSKAAFSKFSEIYKNALSEIDTKPKLTEEAQDVLDKLTEKLHVEVTEDDFDSEGNLLILQIIKRASSEIGSKEVKYVKDSVYKLWHEGAITLRQCLDAIEWLSNHYKAEKIKEKCADDILDIIDDHKNITDKEENYGVI